MSTNLLRSDYSSGYRNNIIYAKYPVDGTLPGGGLTVLLDCLVSL